MGAVSNGADQCRRQEKCGRINLAFRGLEQARRELGVRYGFLDMAMAGQSFPDDAMKGNVALSHGASRGRSRMWML